MPSKKFLEILFKKDDNFLRDKLQDSEIEDQLKAALEKENTQDFIKLQEVRIKRMMDIVNDQEQLQNLIISERYNQFKIKLVQIFQDFISFISKAGEDKLIKMVGEGASSEDVRKIGHFMRVFAEFYSFQQNAEEFFGVTRPTK